MSRAVWVLVISNTGSWQDVPIVPTGIVSGFCELLLSAQAWPKCWPLAMQLIEDP